MTFSSDDQRQQQGYYPPAPGYPAQGSGYGPPPGYPQPAYPLQAQSNGMAVAGLVCGIIGLVFCWFPYIGWILAILGIIFGGVGLSRANKGAPGKGMAIAGLVCGAVAIVLGIILIAAVVHTFANMSTSG